MFRSYRPGRARQGRSCRRLHRRVVIASSQLLGALLCAIHRMHSPRHAAAVGRSGAEQRAGQQQEGASSSSSSSSDDGRVQAAASSQRPRLQRRKNRESLDVRRDCRASSSRASRHRNSNSRLRCRRLSLQKPHLHHLLPGQIWPIPLRYPHPPMLLSLFRL